MIGTPARRMDAAATRPPFSRRFSTEIEPGVVWFYAGFEQRLPIAAVAFTDVGHVKGAREADSPVPVRQQMANGIGRAARVVDHYRRPTRARVGPGDGHEWAIAL